MSPPPRLIELLKYVPPLLRSLREEHGDSRESLARKLGVTVQSLAAAEKARADPPFDVFFLTLQVYDMTPAEAQERLQELQRLERGGSSTSISRGLREQGLESEEVESRLEELRSREASEDGEDLE